MNEISNPLKKIIDQLEDQIKTAEMSRDNNAKEGCTLLMNYYGGKASAYHEVLHMLKNI